MGNERQQNRGIRTPQIRERSELRRQVEEVVSSTKVIDIHTHLFAPQFGELNLYGIDELLTYHYLIAETFRSTDVSYESFWQLCKSDQADLVWKSLFVENTPISEAARGVVTLLSALKLDPSAPNLKEARAFFQSLCMEEHLERVLETAGVSDVVMTNDPFDTREAHIWESGAEIDGRFHAALRLDRILNNWQNTAERILYLAVSLPAVFKFPDADARDRILREVVLPTAREQKLPLAVMIGVRRGVNPALRRAGDGLGRADVEAVERMCAEYPDVRFMATFLSRENQHELCVAARKFNNLMPFGCWWFLNNPSIVSEITNERLELLGTSFIAQHSDASILEQLIYKWRHSREIIAASLCDAYERLLGSGRAVTREEIERDVTRLFSGNFNKWVGGLPGPAPLAEERQPEETDIVTAYRRLLPSKAIRVLSSQLKLRRSAP